jgi:hypothetical protein
MKRLLALLLLPFVAYGADIGIPGQALNQGQMIGGIGADGLFHFLLLGNDGGLTISSGSSGVVTQASTTSGQSGMLMQGAVTTSAPTYTTAQTNPLSLTTAGGLRTSETNWPTTVDTNSGNKSASTPRFVLATDQPSLTTPLNVNQAQLAGTTVDTNSGNKSAGTQRFVLATDQPNLTTALNVKGAFSTTTATGQVTTSGSAGTLVAANATRRRAILKNTDTTITVYVGPATVTTANGMPIKAGESIEWRGTALIQVIAASGSPVVAYMDESD